MEGRESCAESGTDWDSSSVCVFLKAIDVRLSMTARTQKLHDRIYK